MKWNEVKLGDYLDFSSGPAFKSKDFTDNPNDIPLIKGENIGIRCILWEKSKYFPESEARYYKDAILQPHDIVLAMDRPWIEAGLKFGWINENDPKALLVQRVARLRGKKGLDQTFLRYIVSSPDFSSYLKNIQGGVGVPHISGGQIKAFSFRLPPLPIQQKIASILSAYDDLIENNLKRIRLLEEAAQRLYQEWFVRFRFPGWEEAEFGPDGLPVGWERVPLSKVANIEWGDTKVTKAQYTEIGYNAYSASGCDGKLNYFDFERSGIVLSAIGAYAGLTWFAMGKWTAIKNTIKFWSNDKGISDEYLFFATYGMNYWIRRGAAQPFIALGDAKIQTITYPEPNLVGKFTQIARSMLTQISFLNNYNQKLKEAREILLPRLMDQRIEIELK